MSQYPAWHKTDCSGCPICDAELASLSSMSREEYSAWLNNGGYKGKKGWPRAVSEPRAAEYKAPDPWTAAIAKLRGEHIDLVATDDPRHKADPSVPPDSYMLAIALDRAKKEMENDR